jgi:uncharacterized membrane protein YuzA (DUF378 family)
MVTVKQFFYKVARNGAVVALIMIGFTVLDELLARDTQIGRADLLAILCGQTSMVAVALITVTGYFFVYLRQVFVQVQVSRQEERNRQLRHQAYLYAQDKNNRRERAVDILVEEIYEYFRKYQTNPKS